MRSGRSASGLDLEDVEDALLVAALRQPEGDVGAVRRRREPVERHLGAGPGARVDDRPATGLRSWSRPQGPARSRLRRRRAETSAVRAARERRRATRAAGARVASRRALERGQGADRLAGGRVLALLPAAGLGRVLLEPAVGVVERDSADRVHDRYRHARRSMKLRSDFPRRVRRARPRLDPDAGRRPPRGADLAARGRRGATRCRRSSSTSRTARTTRRPSATRGSTPTSPATATRRSGSTCAARATPTGILEDEYLPQEQEDGVEVIALARRPAVVHGRRRHDRQVVGRLQRAPDRRPRARRSSRRSSASARRTTATPTTSTTSAAASSAPTCCSWASTMLAFNARPPDPAVVGERWRELWLERLERTPPFVEAWLSHQRRDELLEAGLGLRGLRRDRLPGLHGRRLGRRLPERDPALPRRLRGARGRA